MLVGMMGKVPTAKERMDGLMLCLPCQMIRGNGVSSSSSCRGRCEVGTATVEASKDPKVNNFFERTITALTVIIHLMILVPVDSE